MKYKLVFIFLFAPSVFAGYSAIPHSMAALGDSMTAGVLTPYRRQEALMPWNQVRILWNSLELLATGDKDSLAFPKFSWSTGQALNSHATRLRELSPNLISENFAQPTGFSKNIFEEQIPALKKWSQENLGQDLPDYVTLLIGHNDLCGSKIEDITSVPTFKKNIHLSLQALLTARTKTKILVSPMARIDALPEVVGDSFLLPMPGFYHCRDVWRRIPLCTTITQRESPATQKLVKKRLQDFNGILRTQVQAARKVYGDRIRFAGEMANYIPQPEDVSVDCFHANKDAQAKIADKTWSATWWSKP